MRRSLSITPPELVVALWNRGCPVGTPVRYRPVAGAPETVDTATRSEAWLLGSGEPVVMVNGRSGGVAISHLELIEVAS